MWKIYVIIYLGGEVMKDYLTVQEVANKFNVSRQAVHKWIKEGKLKADKIAGTTIRIKLEEVNKLIEEVK